MLLNRRFFVLTIFLLIVFNERISALSSNQPALCSTVKWSQTATTFVNSDLLGTKGADIFIDRNNTIYVAPSEKHQILIWNPNSIHATKILRTRWSASPSIFVSNIGEVYVGVDISENKILKWVSSANNSGNIMEVKTQCASLFVTSNGYLYCASVLEDIVWKTPLDDEMEMVVVTGTGRDGSSDIELDDPEGIFVDTDSDLYVADSMNDRIQLFRLDETVGETVAGQSSSDITIGLSQPHSIILDAYNYLFISDDGNNRIVASGPNGFRCLVGCDGGGTRSHQLKSPQRLRFDIYGNLFVVDKGNSRIQKFDLLEDSCVDVPTTIQATFSSTLTEDHERFARAPFYPSAFFYEVIEMFVSQNGFYIITSVSSIGLYGYVYKDRFHSFDPTSRDLIAWNGERYSNDQFEFTLELHAYAKYILVVTTYNPFVTGPFSITVFGSPTVQLKHIDIEQFIESTYTSSLTHDSKKYSPIDCEAVPREYYEAIHVNVIESGFYTIMIDEITEMGMKLYIYEHDFYALIPFGYLLKRKDTCERYESRTITLELLSDIRYVFVVTVCMLDQMWDFSFKIFGKSHVYFQRTDASPVIYSTYSSELTTDNQKYDKECTRVNYYYETIELTVFADTYYDFSIMQSSDINIYIYENHFDPLNPKKNLISIDEHICSNGGEIKHTVYLRSDIIYTLLAVKCYFTTL
ncbi:unnamed protein product [Adineta ricciae]|uniref:Uncharacterized protein n=1 Tax=Adineta ricciae TaxID=249248 RepID=A0A815LTS3_ADIRI|nr:unnamed protein product [Adineta ricciae]